MLGSGYPVHVGREWIHGWYAPAQVAHQHGSAPGGMADQRVQEPY